MPDVSTLEQRRERAILQLDDFLCRECGATRIPDLDSAQIEARNFVAGWRLTIQPLQQPRKMNLCVDGLFPFSAPRFQLIAGPPFPTWPHIEKDGMLCLGDETFTVDPSQPVAVVRQLLVQMAFPLLRASENGSNREDFRTEFYSYWNATVPAGEPPVRSLLIPHGPSRRVRIWRGQHFAVVGEKEDSVLQWLKNLYGDQKQFDGTEGSCLLWLDKVLLPEQYPQRSSDVREIANSSGGAQFLSELVVKEKSPIPVVFGSSSENGPCFGAVIISNAKQTNVIGRRVNSIEAGFRPGHVPQKLAAERVLNSSTPITRKRVERADASWIHGRDQDPRQAALACRRVAIIGCGAIGGPVANELAMAGVGHLLLIDPENLIWANVGRHPLGADSVGFGKASQLAKKLTVNFPHAHFDSRTEEFGSVVEKEPNLLLDCDLIVCATGIWSVESALNAWHFSKKRPAGILYSWTEPHACAGHAVAVKPNDACLQCQFSPLGDPKKVVTDFGSEGPRHEPACGAVYQPYGPVELSWTTALASMLALDCLVGKISISTHRIWAGPKTLLDAAGGSWHADWIRERKEREGGGFLEERVWEKDASCSICN
jgi:sulfur-carrier protein adenylyltransferase/sulfurtransferase